MRRPGSGVSQRPELRHCLDDSLLVGYNVMSLLWRKRTPIPAWGPGVVCYAGSFLAHLQESVLPLTGTLGASCMNLQPNGLRHTTGQWHRAFHAFSGWSRRAHRE